MITRALWPAATTLRTAPSAWLAADGTAASALTTSDTTVVHHQR
jgi:hypothetical protein